MALNPDFRITLFVGGVGGAKLAFGLAQILPPERLKIVVNVGDDMWHLGLRICPDSDTVMYTLTGLVDPINGWGLAGDSTRMLEALRRLDADAAWFRLGELDTATHLRRTNLLRGGMRMTEVTANIGAALGLKNTLLPVTDSEVPTIIDTAEHGELAFQEYFVRHRWQPTVTGIRFAGAENAHITPEVAQAVEEADALIFAPSNPWLSIAPMLAIGDLRARILARDVPRLAVTPIIGGQAVKGPAAKIMAELGLTPSAEAVADYYGDLLNGFVDDIQNVPFARDGLRMWRGDTLMPDDSARVRLARDVLSYIESWTL